MFSFQGAPSRRLRSTILVTSRRIAGRKQVQTFSVSPCVWSSSSTVSHVSVRCVSTRMRLVSSLGPVCACTSPSCFATWPCARTVASPRITLATSSRSSTLGSRLESHSSPRNASMALASPSAARAARRLRRLARRNSLGGRSRCHLAQGRWCQVDRPGQDGTWSTGLDQGRRVSAPWRRQDHETKVGGRLDTCCPAGTKGRNSNCAGASVSYSKLSEPRQQCLRRTSRTLLLWRNPPAVRT